MLIKQYVIFRTEDREFGIDIDKVKTIEKITAITRVPGAQDFVMGVINLRGEVIPVFDARKRMGLKEREFDKESRIIILSIDDMEVGITADTATEVIDIEADLIDSGTEFTLSRDDSYIDGIVRVKDRIIAILNLEKLLKIE